MSFPLPPGPAKRVASIVVDPRGRVEAMPGKARNTTIPSSRVETTRPWQNWLAFDCLPCTENIRLSSTVDTDASTINVV